MFGAQQNKPLFGSSNTTAPAPGAFGAFGQQQPGTSLFGAPNANSGANANAAQQQQPQQQEQQPQQQQQQQQQQFGQPGGSNLFGSTQQQQQQPAPGLFGASSTNPQAQTQTQGAAAGFGAPSTFTGFGSNQATAGSSLFGQSQPQQQQQQQSAPNVPLFTRSTKFNDLPDDLRKKFEQIDTHIQGRVQISNVLRQNNLGDEPQKGAEQIRSVHKLPDVPGIFSARPRVRVVAGHLDPLFAFLRAPTFPPRFFSRVPLLLFFAAAHSQPRDLVNGINKLRADIASMRELRARMDQAVQDTIAATRIIDAFRSPQSAQQGAWLKHYAAFPLEFFTRVTEQLRERLQWFNNTLEQIERKLASEANHVSITPQSITATLQAQHASFVALASKAAALDGALQALKGTYRQLWRARTGSARDPFSAADRGALGGGEFGLEGLSVA
ncbi:hypothetical protein DFH11DRAFT_1541185 [Phellopilus nigrolimitatus]|nr:hypothetical protein DFH11DRAFT_1541185 [Phellopilus nigrolimitatus]